jgi:hemolysin type calcium binding protein
MKLNSTLTAALGAAVLLAAAPALASAADSQTGPVRLNSVQIFSTPSPDVDYFPGSADIAFTNDSDVPATNVEFALEANGVVLDRIEDVGSFAQGVTIKHHFSDTETSADQKVAVAKVTFADGSVWTNPAVPEAPAAPAVVGVGTDEY